MHLGKRVPNGSASLGVDLLLKLELVYRAANLRARAAEEVGNPARSVSSLSRRFLSCGDMPSVNNVSRMSSLRPTRFPSSTRPMPDCSPLVCFMASTEQLSAMLPLKSVFLSLSRKTVFPPKFVKILIFLGPSWLSSAWFSFGASRARI